MKYCQYKASNTLPGKDVYRVFLYTRGNVKGSDSKLMVDINVIVHYNSLILLSCTRMSVVSEMFFLQCFLYLHFFFEIVMVKQMNLKQHAAKT